MVGINSSLDNNDNNLYYMRNISSMINTDSPTGHIAINSNNYKGLNTPGKKYTAENLPMDVRNAILYAMNTLKNYDEMLNRTSTYSPYKDIIYMPTEEGKMIEIPEEIKQEAIKLHITKPLEENLDQVKIKEHMNNVTDEIKKYNNFVEKPKFHPLRVLFEIFVVIVILVVVVMIINLIIHGKCY